MPKKIGTCIQSKVVKFNIYLSWLNHSEQKLNVVKDILKNLLLADPEVRIIIIGVRTDVDDSIHVQIEIVKLRNLIFLHHLAQTWIPLTQPPIKLRNPHLDGF